MGNGTGLLHVLFTLSAYPYAAAQLEPSSTACSSNTSILTEASFFLFLHIQCTSWVSGIATGAFLGFVSWGCSRSELVRSITY